jgi:putative endonuclease
MSDNLPNVCILANARNGTLYVGVTSDLIQRIWQHRNDVVEGFSKKYRTHKLVHFEQHAAMADAILRRSKSRNGIESGNWS